MIKTTLYNHYII